jgi:hypothetical protein
MRLMTVLRRSNSRTDQHYNALGASACSSSTDWQLRGDKTNTTWQRDGHTVHDRYRHGFRLGGCCYDPHKAMMLCILFSVKASGPKAQPRWMYYYSSILASKAGNNLIIHYNSNIASRDIAHDFDGCRMWRLMRCRWLSCNQRVMHIGIMPTVHLFTGRGRPIYYMGLITVVLIVEIDRVWN